MNWVELNIIVSENINHHREQELDEDLNVYVNPNPISVEEDKSDYMRLDRQMELVEDGHVYSKPISKLGASSLIEEPNYSETKPQSENPYINCKFVDA